MDDEKPISEPMPEPMSPPAEPPKMAAKPAVKKAKVVVTTITSGRLRPAMAKSLVVLMRVPAQTPRAKVPSR